MSKYTWYVYRPNINSRTVEAYDVLSHPALRADILRAFNRENRTLADFMEDVRKAVSYYFRRKAEYEVYVSESENHSVLLKIDPYDQIMMNFDSFVAIAAAWSCYTGCEALLQGSFRR